MGNCQAAEAAAVLIQQPGGKVERMYWAIAAGEVMKANPGHYVAAVLATPPGAPAAEKTSPAPVRHLKLLRPDDILCLGRVYRLVTFEEVLKELSSRSHSRMSKLRLPQQQAQREKTEEENTSGDSLLAEELQQEESDSGNVAGGAVGSSYGGGGGGGGGGGAKHGHWRPSLQSISEVAGM